MIDARSPRVVIVVLHWRGLFDTIECIESLRSIRYPNWDLVLVLNGASEADSSRLITEVPPSSRIIRLPQNQGFARGSNLGITMAVTELNADYVLLLNNDTVVEPDFLGFLVARAESDSQVGVVGAKTYYFGSWRLQFTIGNIDLWRGRLYHLGDGEEDIGQFDQPSLSGYVQGSCLLIRASLLDCVGLLDEAFFAYWEETDFCLRVRSNGFRVFYEPRAVVWHKTARSSASTTKLYYLLRNNIYFARKHTQWYQWITFLPYFMIRTTPVLSFYVFLDDPLGTFRAVAAAYHDGLRMRPVATNKQA